MTFPCLQMNASPQFSCNPCPANSGLKAQLIEIASPAANRVLWTRVKSFAAIAATLDEHGMTDGLPFMSEMVVLCGRYGIRRPANRVCMNGFRKLERVYHLDPLRCSGADHGGCEAGCLLFWHESWLEMPNNDSAETPGENDRALANQDEAWLHSCCTDAHTGNYVCQATTVGQLGTELPLPGPQHLILEFVHGRMGKREAKLLWQWLFNLLLLRIYTRAFRKHHSSSIQNLNLQVGDMVRVRSRMEILKTLGPGGCHYGLRVVPDMLRYCGKVYRVTGKVRRLIEPELGKMREINNECIVLEGVTCSGGRTLCSRREMFFWREAWLTRV